MIGTLKNGKKVFLRQLQASDAVALYNYFQNLSANTKLRFAPHPFDWDTVKEISSEKNADCLRFVAIHADNAQVVAYMILQPRLVVWDLDRYKRRGQLIKPESSASFAPSVANEWQGSGLAIMMSKYIEAIALDLGIRKFVLWGGVQASNEQAIRFYQKLNYQTMGNFYFEGKENMDMCKQLE